MVNKLRALMEKKIDNIQEQIDNVSEEMDTLIKNQKDALKTGNTIYNRK